MNLSQTRWRGLLLRNTPVDWKDTWRAKRAQKESAFIWSIWHKAIAVNEWRQKININTDVSCPLCPGLSESIIHRFWECTQAYSTWTWCSSLIHAIQKRPSDPSVHFRIDWHHCIFTQKLPRRFGKFSMIWSLLRGLTLWELWICRNAKCFKNETWPSATITGNIWRGLQDYARLAYYDTTRSTTDNNNEIRCRRFDSTWGSNKILCHRIGNNISWPSPSNFHQGRVALHPLVNHV